MTSTQIVAATTQNSGLPKPLKTLFPKKIPILFLGASGVGKSTLVQETFGKSYSQPDCKFPEGTDFEEPSSDFFNGTTEIKKYDQSESFVVYDTPGFESSQPEIPKEYAADPVVFVYVISPEMPRPLVYLDNILALINKSSLKSKFIFYLSRIKNYKKDDYTKLVEAIQRKDKTRTYHSFEDHSVHPTYLIRNDNLEIVGYLCAGDVEKHHIERTKSFTVCLLLSVTNIIFPGSKCDELKLNLLKKIESITEKPKSISETNLTRFYFISPTDRQLIRLFFAAAGTLGVAVFFQYLKESVNASSSDDEFYWSSGKSFTH
jgi:GTPase SAR1 family protein